MTRSLAILVLLTALPLQGQTPAEKKETIAYLRSLQTTEGGFAPAKGGKPSLRATSAAIRALKYQGGEVPDRAAARKFVAACFDKASGGFRDQPGGKPDVTTTAVGLMAVVELKMPVEDYAGPAMNYLGKHAKTFEEVRIAAAGLEAIGKLPPQADDWLKMLAGMRNKDGTYGKGEDLARATGGAVACQLRLGGKVTERDAILKALKAGQRDDGGYGKAGAKTSDLETTYRVLRTFVMLKDRPGEAKLRGFIARCRNADGGYGVSPGEKSTVGGTYFASIISHWLESK
jgi:prenyltransferase beta subunit